jgi:hypothetical protein
MLARRTDRLGVKLVAMNRLDEITTSLKLRHAHGDALLVREADLMPQFLPLGQSKGQFHL